MINLNKHSGIWDVTCDRCSSESTEIEADDFREVVRLIKREGWSVYKDENDEWVHACVDCGLK